METSNLAIELLLQRAGGVYMAGPSTAEARAVCEGFAAEGIASTICYWNGRRDTPRAVADKYLVLIDVIRDLKSDCYLSIKAPALEFNFGLLTEILRRAERTNTTVHFDSMAPDTVNRTFALIDAARRVYPNLGFTLPARWRRSVRDADFAAEAGLRVRVVKGQWSGLNGDETNSREGFEKLIESLAENGVRHVAVATHNPAAASYAIAALKTARIPCDLELLYGLPVSRMLEFARQQDICPRVYVPCGHPALPYRLSEAGHDPRILFWFARDLIRSAS